MPMTLPIDPGCEASAACIHAAAIEIVAGHSGRDKLISVLGMDGATVHQRILAHMG